MSDAWSCPPENLNLEKHEVHVWSVAVSDAAVCAECCGNLLSADERDRAARFKFSTDRQRYVVAHAALRSILARYLNVKAMALQFSSGPQGKPKLAPPLNGSKLEFNLAHSNEVALVAVAQEIEVGVDVEYVRQEFPFVEIAHRFFSSREVAALGALPSQFQRRAFYQCWTSKEAFLKAKGTGLSGKLDEVDIALTSEGVVRLRSTLPDWTLTELEVADDYAGALVVEGEPREATCYRWQGLMAECVHRQG
jgi:4'-phosphopantetheinyl transferase